MNDRELDALVAEKVMGEKPEIVWIARDDDDEPDATAGAYLSTNGWQLFPNYTKRDIEQWLLEHPIVCGKKTRLGKWEHHKPYSTDIAAAWEVLEKMRERGLRPGVNLLDSGWHGYFVDPSVVEDVVDVDGRSIAYHATAIHGYADTAPRAICLAALRSVGVEVPQ